MKISMNGAGDPAILYLRISRCYGRWARTYETLTNVRRVPVVDQAGEHAVARPRVLLAPRVQRNNRILRE
jgi:hypothetical protein